MLFALKEIFDAAKSSAFTVGCLRTLFYIKMQMRPKKICSTYRPSADPEL